MDKISVIVTAYNIEMYLEKCIESICNQTYKDIEIVLVDDGSIDKTAKICDEFAILDNRIRVVHTINGGVVKARKIGLQIATGDYIAYVDGDDWIESNMIARLYENMKLYNADIVMCGRYEETGLTSRAVFHGIEEGYYDKQKLKDLVYPRMIKNGSFFEWGLFPGVWDKLWKRNNLYKYQMSVDESISMGEDAACTYPALLNANSICVLKECLYHYRQTTTSMVKNIPEAANQRNKFHILYSSVNKSLENLRDIYDVRDQWLDYILFLMVPRAGVLYKGIENLNFLFPFPNVKKGSNIVIYGMGTFGQLLYRYIISTDFCNIVLCVDRNYIELRKQGLVVYSPDEIKNYEYDAIVVANSFAKAKNEIFIELSNKYSDNKIHLIDENLIKSSDSLKAFGLQ